MGLPGLTLSGIAGCTISDIHQLLAITGSCMWYILHELHCLTRIMAPKKPNSLHAMAVITEKSPHPAILAACHADSVSHLARFANLSGSSAPPAPPCHTPACQHTCSRCKSDSCSNHEHADGRFTSSMSDWRVGPQLV